MADRHKNPPKAVRMPGGLEAWYENYAASAGMPVNGVIVKALEEFRARNSGATASPAGRGAVAPLSIGGIEIPIVVDDRQPPGIVSVIAPGEEATQVRSFALTPDEPAPKPRNCKHPRVHVKGVCPDCHEWAVRS